MGIEVVEPPLRVKYVPTAADLDLCRQFGERIARRLKEHVGA